jgi:acyl CoA:acetate/3-ketoacid CoA transferase beta subunit
LRRVISNFGVFDFETPDLRMRLRSVHPWVSVDEIVEQSGFELVIEGDVPTSREPDADELRWIREVIDPKGICNNEVPA